MRNLNLTKTLIWNQSAQSLCLTLNQTPSPGWRHLLWPLTLHHHWLSWLQQPSVIATVEPHVTWQTTGVWCMFQRFWFSWTSNSFSLVQVMGDAGETDWCVSLEAFLGGSHVFKSIVTFWEGYTLSSVSEALLVLISFQDTSRTGWRNTCYQTGCMCSQYISGMVPTQTPSTMLML